MLIDLGRNDVGRVAETGSVKVVRQMEIERYSHVMHIVSEVVGRIPGSTPPLDVLRAAFPAGTLSGAPKVRAMQIIRELEARSEGDLRWCDRLRVADGRPRLRDCDSNSHLPGRLVLRNGRRWRCRGQ